MWSFQSKRNTLREQLLLQAPEANPSEFIRRYLLQKPDSARFKSRIRPKREPFRDNSESSASIRSLRS